MEFPSAEAPFIIHQLATIANVSPQSWTLGGGGDGEHINETNPASVSLLSFLSNNEPAINLNKQITGSYDYWSILHLMITILLCLISMFVVLGNSLVVGAIWHENQLHSVTNYLIASLAVADCLVGLVVMPFSIISEIIFGHWTFGATWCDLWHSFDVLASTASIMNLCAISLDRYLAITNPITYPTRMTPKRVALLIVSLWTCSALISFPAIIWWRLVGQGTPLVKISGQASSMMTNPMLLLHHKTEEQLLATSINSQTNNNNNNNKQPRQPQQTSSSSLLERTLARAYQGEEGQVHSAEGVQWEPNRVWLNESSTSMSTGLLGGGMTRETHEQLHNDTSIFDQRVEEDLYKCVFTDDTYYLLFSSFVSFYGPLCVMLYAYYRIYKAAVKQMRFLKHGSKQVMISERMPNGSHLGGASNKLYNAISSGSNQTSSDSARNGLVLRVHRGGGGSAGGGGGANLSLKSVLNKQNSVTTTATIPTPLTEQQGILDTPKSSGSLKGGQKLQSSQAVKRSYSSQSGSSQNQALPSVTDLTGASSKNKAHDKVAHVIYYESGKLFHKLSKLNNVPSISIDANSLTSASGATQTRQAHSNNSNGADLQPDSSANVSQVLNDYEELEEPNVRDQNLSRLDNKCQPEGGKGVKTDSGQQLSRSQKLYSNQHAVQKSTIPTANHQNQSPSKSSTPPTQSNSFNPNSSIGQETNIPLQKLQSQQQQQQQQQQQHRKVGRKLSRLAKERKAAKTLGIVVGVFILCWLPYFVVNITVALCGSHCITNLDIFVAIVTWLGWLNSAMNPVIYACWSREFRRAFRRVLCSWVIFFCPYGDVGQRLIKKLQLKESSNYSTNTNATISSQQDNPYSFSQITSSTARHSNLTSSLRGASSGGNYSVRVSTTGGASILGESVVSDLVEERNASNCIVTINSPMRDIGDFAETAVGCGTDAEQQQQQQQQEEEEEEEEAEEGEDEEGEDDEREE